MINIASALYFQLLEVLDLRNTYFPQFGPWLDDVVLPVYNNLFQEDNSSNIVTLDASTPKEEQYTIIVELLEKVAKEPKEVLKQVKNTNL